MRALPQLKISLTEQAITDALQAADIRFEVSLVAMDIMRHDNWKCDQWRVVLTSNVQPNGFKPLGSPLSKVESFDYFTGTGHRRAAKTSPVEAMQKRMYGARWHPELFPCSPSAAGVLYSLLLDADAERENFHAWCDNYGYDNDSKKATKMYEDCLLSARQLNNVMDRDTRGTLSELLQDY